MVSTIVGSYAVLLLAIIFETSIGLNPYISKFTIVLGLLPLFIGSYLRISAAYSFYKQKMKVLSWKSRPKLVETGLFRITRNPHYIALIAIPLGWTLIFGSYLGILIVMATYLICNFWLCPHEEKSLERSFKENYLQYKKNTPRWISLKKGRLWTVVLILIFSTSYIPLYQLSCSEGVSIVMDSHMVEIDGLNIHYRTLGDPNNQPMLYVGGWPMNHILLCSQSSDASIAEFAKHFYVIIPDHPGLNKSDPPPYVWGLDDYAQYIHVLAERENISEPVVLGKSFGGGIAAHYAKNYPEEVSTLILVDSVLKDRREYPIYKYVPFVLPLVDIVRSDFFPFSLKQYLVAGFVNVAEEDITEENYENYLVMTDVLVTLEFDVDFQDLQMPLILVWGDKDAISPVEDAKKIHRLVPDSKLLIFDGGHLVMERNPQEVVGEIVEAIHNKL